MELRFKFGKETRGTFMFNELDEDGDQASEYIVGQLYVRKEYFADKKATPQSAVVVLDLSIEGEDGD